MHSFITILKVLISTMITLLTSFFRTEHWEQGTGGGLAWDLSPQPPNNQYNRGDPGPAQSHRTTTPQQPNPPQQ